MKRSKPIRRRARLGTNLERRKEKRAEAFGVQAELCRLQRCAACRREPCAPHHEPPRRIGNAGGKDEDTIPLCEACHNLRHGINGGKLALQEKTGIDYEAAKRKMRKLAELAASIATEEAHG